jgi:soluble lytic murein transglycosylase
VKRIALLLVGITLLSNAGHPRAQEATPARAPLVPTDHPRVPQDLSQVWLAPDGQRRSRTATQNDFAAAVKLEVMGNFAKALPVLSQAAIRQGSLGDYAEYYKGFAELRLGRPDEARRTFRAVQARGPVGYLTEAAALREAECDEALSDYAAAVAIYERLASTKTTMPDDVLMRLGRAAKAAGDKEKASQAFARVYAEFPLSDQSFGAAGEIDNGPLVAGSLRYRLQRDRAERLFSAKRYEAARSDFDGLRSAAQGNDRELVTLRIAECDYFLKRARAARDLLRPYIDDASRQGEALFFYAVATRDLGDIDEYQKTVRRIVTDFATQSWAEEALNNFGTYQILQDDDQMADETFRELYARFPKGRYAERAAWKIGWLAYRNGQYGETARVFDQAAADFPRSDNRPPWLYWSGRAHEALKEDALADARYSLAAADYMNSYYGRLAVQRLGSRGVRAPERRLVLDGRTPQDVDSAVVENTKAPAAPPRNEASVRALLAVDLYDQALDELRYAQAAWGDSPVIQATIAWIYLQQARAETGSQQFTLLRGAINAMKRAYPQFIAAGGHELPADVLKVIFPMAYWDLIRKYAAQYEVDPYLAAALIAQESTFVPDIRSYANATGLMQLMGPTARQYARVLNLRYSPRLLTNPEMNIRMGMAYFSDKIKQFGEPYLALASYNAGERPVKRWMTERPGLAREEFIDDIPYPQTQNYVKKILGTAEDYRRLYGSGRAENDNDTRTAAVTATASTTTAPTATQGTGATAGKPKAKNASTAVSGRKKKTRKAT